MGTLIVRHVGDDLVELLKERARRHGRSPEAEHRELLKEGLREDRREAVKRRLRDLRASLADRPHTPSEILLRESREER